MPKPVIRKPPQAAEPDNEVLSLPQLDDVPLLVGTEIENTVTNVRYRVECLAQWLADEGAEDSLVLVLRKQLGFDPQFFAVAYTELQDGSWRNLGL